MDWHFKHLIGAKILNGSSIFHNGLDELTVQTADGQTYKLKAAEKDGVSYIGVYRC